MVTATAGQPIVLITVVKDHSLERVLDTNGYAVVQPPTGTLAIEWARDIKPDLIILDAELPDMSGVDACWMFRNDPHIGRNVPVLLVTADKPTPDQRVTALRAGAWDFLRYPGDLNELTLKLQTYVQAKRNIDVALAEGLVDPTTGLHSRSGLARRARELGALMSRNRGALACVVFAVEAEPADPKTGSLVAQSARLSDVVGALGPAEFAVLAPGTDDVGAVKLAERVGGTLREAIRGPGPRASWPTLRIGYDAVANLKYSPIDPVALLSRAAAAVRMGKPEPDRPWVRRFADAGKPAPRVTEPRQALDETRKGGRS
ncbi:MAG TPA: response regulator [Gemmatimonadales bacterium]|nr:response regulator [Gemmatimonadales bacterium]